VYPPVAKSQGVFFTKKCAKINPMPEADKKTTKKIAMAGMYGGMQREYNPGCFMVGQTERGH
jgi:hypothetical protein